jgi:hypothetical protein
MSVPLARVAHRSVAIALSVSLAAAFAACGGRGAGPRAGGTSSGPSGVTAAASGATAAPSGATGATAAAGSTGVGASTGAVASAPAAFGTIRLRDFHTASFGDPTTIDNPWHPAVPGRRLVFRGHALDRGERVSRKVVIIATGLTKVISGVETRVIRELDFDDGALVEKELTFYAQDDDGNIWQVGEFPEEVEDGEVVKTPIWIDGARGAHAGVAMPGHPVLGTPSYPEGLGPDVGWNDRAEIFAMDTRTCSALACYTGVMIVREFNPGEPQRSQLKYYAPGVGHVRVGWRGAKEDEREELVLVSLTRLGRAELARLHADVLEQDAYGYEVSPRVYGTTDPIEPP